ncbi:MAG: RNA polymerase factor sigma-54 [Bacillota bacterium]|nr:RNA polymerase factor sigma-54 [Bacillota bacterium]
MNFKQGLWQQQTLKLTMTQELSQAIALLQYTTQELTVFLEDKALENPLIQIEPGNVQPMDPLRDRSRGKSKKAVKDRNDWIEQIAESSFSLEEHVFSQLPLNDLSSADIKILRYLIRNCEVSGYFTGDTNEAAVALKTTISEVEGILALLQKLEPAGIGARDLKECLLLQLQRHHPDNQLAQTIVTDHFLSFVDKKWKALARELGVSLKEFQEVFDIIQKLNPKPCENFIYEKTSFVIPDAIIEKTTDGIAVRTYDDPLPRITFNENYYKQFSLNEDPTVSRFIQEKFQDFQWIMKSIEQRKETLTKVVMKIAEKQPLFFQKGPEYLRPMTMKEVAGELGIHESTVSRVVREKYVQTPSGTFELRTFFTSTIQTTAEENTSSATVKNAIASLIGNEKKQKPLSDQDIVDLLENGEGIVVSRRTVAKYRDQLGIPSSPKRKRYE